MYASELLLPRGQESPELRDESLMLSSVEDSAANCLMLNKPVQALDFIAQALEIRKHLSPDHLTSGSLAYIQASVKAVSTVSMVLLDSGDLATSQQVLSKLEEILKTLPLAAVAVERCAVLNNLACVYRKGGQLALAKKGLVKALRLCDSFKDLPLDRAGTHLNMCAVLSNLNRHGPALEFGRKAVQYAQEALIAYKSLETDEEATHLIKVLAVAYFNVGAEFEHLTAYGSALEWYMKAVSIIENSKIEALRSMLDGLHKACKGMKRKVHDSGRSDRSQSARKRKESGSSSRPGSASRPNSGSRREGGKTKGKNSRPSSGTKSGCPMPPLLPSSSGHPPSRPPKSLTPPPAVPELMSTKSGKRLLTCINWAESNPHTLDFTPDLDLDSLSKLGLMDFPGEDKPPVRPRIRVRGSKRRSGDSRNIASRPDSAEIWGRITPESGFRGGEGGEDELKLIDLEENAGKIEPSLRCVVKPNTPGTGNLLHRVAQAAQEVPKPKRIVLDQTDPSPIVDERKPPEKHMFFTSRQDPPPNTPPVPKAETHIIPKTTVPPIPKAETMGVSKAETPPLSAPHIRGAEISVISKAETPPLSAPPIPKAETSVISKAETPPLSVPDPPPIQVPLPKKPTPQLPISPPNPPALLKSNTVTTPPHPTPLQSDLNFDLFHANATKLQAVFRGKIARNKFKVMLVASQHRSERILVCRIGKKFENGTYGMISIFENQKAYIFVVVSGRRFELEVKKTGKEAKAIAERLDFDGEKLVLVGKGETQAEEAPLLTEELPPDVLQRISRFQAIFRGHLTRKMYHLLRLKASSSATRTPVYRSGRKLDTNSLGIVTVYRLSPEAVQITVVPTSSGKEFDIVLPYTETNYENLVERVRFNGVAVSIQREKQQAMQITQKQRELEAVPRRSMDNGQVDSMETSGIDRGVRVLAQAEKTLSGFDYLVYVCYYEESKELGVEAEGISISAPGIKKAIFGEMELRARFSLSSSTPLPSLCELLLTSITVQKSRILLLPSVD